MATWPAGIKYAWKDLQESTDPVVERSQMERGRPKQRRVASDVRVEWQMTLEFDTAAEAAEFETWFYDVIDAGQAHFDFPHPRTGATVQARVVGGELGPLRFRNPTREASYRQIKIETWRSGW